MKTEDKLTILTIVGARPQFIKSAAFSYGIQQDDRFREVVVHTGQHYDSKMSEIFFKELKLPEPQYVLEAGGLGHGAMTGRIVEKIEAICQEVKPDIMLVYGDTNSTLAGALAAVKLHIPIAHIEAGLRSFNMNMPEEVNRILTDRISSLLFCPTKGAEQNLQREGFDNFNCEVHVVGDVMFDMVKITQNLISQGTNGIPYILVTIHRAENTDDLSRLKTIFDALNDISETMAIKLPIHPRTKRIIEENKLFISPKVELMEPVGYFEMMSLLAGCEFVMSDSGGVQKEAYFMKKNCLVLRDETEWVELIEHGTNKLVGCNSNTIIEAVKQIGDLSKDFSKPYYGDGKSVKKITDKIYLFLRGN